MPDEYAFKYAEKILNSSDKPLLIYILTVTNHSPFKAPESYQVKPVEVSERLNQLLGPLKEHGTALLSAYQYANDAFGQFITNIKDSPLASNTLIAGTGDHRMRYLDGTLANEFAINYAVPFYLYVPQKILQNVPFQYDSQRIGSHRDIFPTLYNFSLSDASYISLGGNNLLSTQSIESFGYNAQRVINEQGSYDVYQPEKLYPWLMISCTVKRVRLIIQTHNKAKSTASFKTTICVGRSLSNYDSSVFVMEEFLAVLLLMASATFSGTNCLMSPP